MSLENLLNEGLIESIETSPELIEQALSLAEKDLKTAEIVFQTKSYDWALAIAYNSMLHAGRGLMFHFGYRPIGEYKHLAVVKFVAEKLRGESAFLITLFNRTRRRRHKIIYETREIVSESEAKQVIERAKEFLLLIKQKIKKT